MNNFMFPLVARRLWSLLVVGILLSSLATAQTLSGGGTLQGTVKDESGAAIPNAKVIFTNIATGTSSTFVTTDAGLFVTPTVSIGKYKVRIEARGMKAWEGEVQIETARQITIEPVLRVGDVSETVVIEGNITPLVTASEPTVGSTLESMRIKELPINGRNINALLEDTVPGLEAIIDVNGGVRASGLMSYSTDYIQDGASSNNREFGGSGIIQGLESIGEVRVETSTSSAKYNRPTSVIVTTKGGSNQFHATAFETHRNNGFGVARARQDVLFNGQEYKVPTLLRNEYGFSLSGPVFLPKFGEGGAALYNGKNRTFWFFSRESLRLKQGITREFVVPTEAWRRGDFSGMVDSLNRPITLYDPATTRTQTINNRQVAVRDPFPNNIIPANRMSPLARALFAITPLPNDPTVNPLVTNNYKTAVATNGLPNRHDDQNTIRLDHRFSDKDSGWFKVNGGKNRANFLGTAGNNGAPTLNNEANVTYLPMEGITGGLSWTHLFSPKFYVETVANRTWQSTRTVTGPTTEDFSQRLGLPNPLGELGFPNITGNGFMNYIEGDNRRALYTIVTNAEQNFSWIKGEHNFQFGWRWNNQRQHLQPDQGAISGSAAFSSLATALHSPTLGNAASPQAVPQTGHDAANFFLGAASTYTVGLKRNFMKLNERYFGFYVQDSWRLSNRLTLSPGARWDMFPAFSEKHNAINAFDEKTRTMYFPEPVSYYIANGTTTQKVIDAFKSVGVKFASAEEIGRDKDIYKSNLFDIGPRMGIAYKMFDGNKQFVIRGGYGLYISNTPMRSLLAPFFGLPPFRANFLYDMNTAARTPDGINNFLLRNRQTVIAGQNSTNVVNAVDPVGIGIGQAVAGMAENQKNLRIHEWNVTLEKQIGASSVVRLNYTGKHGVNADQQNNINPQANDYVWFVTQQRATPTGATAAVARRLFDQTAYTNITIYQKTGFINTAVWTLEFERRFSKGLGFQAFYTMTNALRMSGNSFRDDVGTRPDVFLPGTVPTDFEALNRYLYYDRDTAVPKHRIRANWNYDLPFGKGRWLGKSANSFVNGVIGGWKMVGKVAFLNTWYARPTGQWGEFSNFEIYGKKYKITDCRATPAAATTKAQERCTDGYLWFNGYIPQRLINSTNAAGLRNGVFGLPDNYKPGQKPINPSPLFGQPVSTDPNIANDYDTNVVYIPLTKRLDTATGQIVAQNANCDLSVGARLNCQRIAKDTGVHPWRNQYHMGPFNWNLDMSLMKFFKIQERLTLRVNLDVFNVLNRQGLNAPSAEGIASLANSYGGSGFRPRQLQGTIRLEW
ncbi:MAG TPA: TonB-dependent receptor [Blastocatellia bacterium]|nr:TonB-dependent receptor [Blastocatellia bacterium]